MPESVRVQIEYDASGFERAIRSSIQALQHYRATGRWPCRRGVCCSHIATEPCVQCAAIRLRSRIRII